MFRKVLKIFTLPMDESVLSEDRRHVLFSRLVVLILIVTITYFFIDKIINTKVTSTIFICLIVSCILILALHINGHYRTSKVIGLLLINFILYNVSSSEPYETGVHLHLLTASFVALVIFGHENRVWGMSFIFLSMLLYVLSYFYGFSILDERSFNLHQTNVFFVVNVTVFAIINVSLLVMMLRLNYKAEGKLVKSNEEVLLQNEKLLQVNAELDRFVYSASHELRSPLTSMLGLISLQKLDKPNSNIYLDMILSRIHVMDDFIRNTIDYSRNDRTQIVNETINLHQAVIETVESFKHSELKTHLRFEVNIEPDLEFISDSFRFRIVLQNLIHNSIKYKDLNKSDPYVKIFADGIKDILIVKVLDNGIGIEENLQSRIFEMFYRATNLSDGSGLGLYIARQSVLKLNGKISFKSTFGIGSSFTIVVPLKPRTINAHMTAK